MVHNTATLSFVPTPTGGYEIKVDGASVRNLKGAIAPLSQPVTLQHMDDAIAAGITESAS